MSAKVKPIQISTAKVIDNSEMNRLRGEDISKKEEERQREDARAARGSQREPVVVVGWLVGLCGGW